MTEPFVSVLMAARNHERYAADAAASILDQDYERLELVAVDDASDDTTGDVLESCAADALPGRMRFVRHERREGIAETRAHALSLARGDFIGVVGSPTVTKPKTGAGELTIVAENVVVLTKATRPLPEKWHGLSDVEVRYRQRYVDLIAGSLKLEKDDSLTAREVFERRAAAVKELRRILDADAEADWDVTEMFVSYP